MRIQTDKITVVQAWSFVLMTGEGEQIYPQYFHKQINKTTSLTLDILIRWSVHMVASYYLKKCLHCPRKWRSLFVENLCKYDLKKKERLINLEKHAMYGPETRQMTSIGGAALDTQWTYQSNAFIIYPVHKYIITTALICRLKIYPNLTKKWKKKSTEKLV